MVEDKGLAKTAEAEDKDIEIKKDQPRAKAKKEPAKKKTTKKTAATKDAPKKEAVAKEPKKDGAKKAVKSEYQVKLSERISKFLRGAWSELKKVQWPNRQQIIAFTGVVFAAVLIVSLLIWILDSGLSQVLKLLFD